MSNDLPAAINIPDSLSGNEIFRLLGENGNEYADLKSVTNYVRDNASPTAIGTIVLSVDQPGDNWLECDGSLLSRYDYPDLQSQFPTDGMEAIEKTLPDNCNGFSSLFCYVNRLIAIPFGNVDNGDISEYQVKTIFVSVDMAESWTLIEDAFNGESIAAGSDIVRSEITDRYVIADKNSNKIYYSDDIGTTWTAIALPTTSNNRNQLFCFYGYFFSIQSNTINNTITIYTSNDAVTWTRTDVDMTGLSADKLSTGASNNYHADGITVNYNNEFGELVFYKNDLAHPVFEDTDILVTNKHTYKKYFLNSVRYLSADITNSKITTTGNVPNTQNLYTSNFNNFLTPNIGLVTVEHNMCVVKRTMEGNLYADVYDRWLFQPPVTIKLVDGLNYDGNRFCFADRFFCCSSTRSFKLFNITKVWNTFNIPFYKPLGAFRSWILAIDPNSDTVYTPSSE